MRTSSAQAIFGIVSWIVLSPGWVGKGGDAAFALRMADAVVDHLEHGLARSPPRRSIAGST